MRLGLASKPLGGRVIAAVLPGLVALAYAMPGCGGTDGSAFGDGDGGVDGGLGDGAPQLDGNDPFGDTGAGDSGPPCAVSCSSDLHSVVDCHGTVKKTCPDDQGCDPQSGDCVAACDSAKANKGSIGCEFYAVTPDGSQYGGSCFAMYLANTWNSPVTVTGDFKGSGINVGSIARIPKGNGAAITYSPLTNNQIPAGEVAILFLSGSGCPVTSGNLALGTSGTMMGNAVRIATDRPVSAYDIYPYGGGTSAITSATLLLPTSAWDTNYVAVSPFNVSQVTNAPGAVHLVAQQNGTKITILPTQNIAGGGGVAAATKNTPKTYALDKGQEIVFAQTNLLDGSPIQANYPVGMWASMSCFNVPASVAYCDSAHQQVPPVQALGSEYVLVRYRNRLDNAPEESVPWRLLGLVDGTQLTWEPSTPSGAPTTLNQGQLATFSGTGPYVVHSQDEKHPFYVSAHMTGCSSVGSINGPPEGCVGDAEYVNVVPAKEFQSSYVFFTDPTYPETDLVLVRSKGGDAKFHDVTLDCAGALTGWQPVGSKGDYEFTRFDLVRHNFQKQGSCDNGRHEIKSDAPFGVTVWGWGTLETGSTFYTQAVSYAYPGGMSLKPINTVVIPPVPK